MGVWPAPSTQLPTSVSVRPRTRFRASNGLCIYIAIESYEDTNRMCEVALNIVSKMEDPENRSKETRRLKDVQKQILDRRAAAGGKPV
jgi:hypothetical protein